MTGFLTRILAAKEEEVATKSRKRPLKDLKRSIRSLPAVRSLASALRTPRMSIMAEVKKASPSAGVLTSTVPRCRIGPLIDATHASELPVLRHTEFFQGSLEF